MDLSGALSRELPGISAATPDRLRQVVTNLVGNAVKFTQQGHVLIAAEALEQDGAERRMRFSVTDTGIGIAQRKSRSSVREVHSSRRLYHTEIWRHRIGFGDFEATDRTDGQGPSASKASREGVHLLVHCMAPIRNEPGAECRSRAPI